MPAFQITITATYDDADPSEKEYDKVADEGHKAIAEAYDEFVVGEFDGGRFDPTNVNISLTPVG